MQAYTALIVGKGICRTVHADRKISLRLPFEDVAMQTIQSSPKRSSWLAADNQSVVVFHLDRRTYALPIESITQILPIVTLTPSPQDDSIVKGMINVHSELVPLVDLRAHLGLPAAPWELDSHILLAQGDDWVAGLLVDEVVDVIALPQRIAHPAELLPTGITVPSIWKGAIQRSDCIVILLDPERLFQDEQVQSLQAALSAIEKGQPEPEPAIQLAD